MRKVLLGGAYRARRVGAESRTRMQRFAARLREGFAALLWSAVRGLVPLIAFALRLRVKYFPRRSVLYAGQAYYNAWYLSRALRRRGWRADVLNWDTNLESQMYYHGEDFTFAPETGSAPKAKIRFYLRALWNYDIFHFSNAHGMLFGTELNLWFRESFGGDIPEVRFLKCAGKKIAYSNNGCLDGVSQTSFGKWGSEPVCNICPWKNVPQVCSDERNLAWGEFRNSMADYQCLTGGNRVDYNDDPRVHEVPEFYCLDTEMWRPELDIPEKYRLGFPPGTVTLYHAVGNFDSRTGEHGVNIKSTHVYRPLVERLKAEGFPVEFIFFSKVPNKEVRFYQAQADIFLDMLSFGWFGATAREAMMLGKPVICYLRPEWLESARREIPEYVDELPIVSATPDTIRDVLVELVANASKRGEIGARSRAFALKWHSADAGARRMERIYMELLGRA
ncbi:MAG TPA: glycosyltransferase family 1 protein [Burkholderiales bacterium]|nr:glycosyltransferase family 1 protein [Burkholderiales bacterium]